MGEAGPLGRAGGAQDPSLSCSQASGSRNPGSGAQDPPGRCVSRTDLEAGASGAAESGAECMFCFGGVSLRGLSPHLLAVAARFAAPPSLVFLL